MKILIFSEACFNDNIFPLFKAMKGKGHDVTCLINLSSLKVMLFDIEKRIPKQRIIKATEYKELRIYEKYMDMENLYLVNHEVDRRHPWRDITRTIDVYRFIKSGNFDVIHTDMQMSRSYKFLYNCFGSKMVFVQHDPVEHSGMEWSNSTKKLFSYIHKHVNKFVILSPQYYSEFCRTYNHSGDKVLINALGPLECITLHKKDNITPRKNNILYFGRISKYKGIEYLCKAMIDVHKKIPDATLTIAGAGDFYFDIDSYKKSPYIEFVNRFITEDELANLLQECAFTICYYTDATQSGGVLTSFSMNKPVIASDIEAMRYIVKNGYNGLLVAPCNSDALSQSIVNLLQNKSQIEEMTNNIKQDYISGDNSWGSIVDKYIEFYKK